MGRPEAYVEQYLVEQCKKAGFICWKLVCPSTSGVPDRMVIGNGKTAFAECKKPGGKVRTLQRKRILQMRDAGAHVEVLDTREGVDQFIQDMMK